MTDWFSDLTNRVSKGLLAPTDAQAQPECSAASERPFFECPGCGKDIADTEQPHAANCPRVPVEPQQVEVTEAAQFLLDRLDEFDPGEDAPEREYHGHVAPAIARLRSALTRPAHAPVSASEVADLIEDEFSHIPADDARRIASVITDRYSVSHPHGESGK